MVKYIFSLFLCVALASCALLQNQVATNLDCKKNSIKELKRLKKYLSEPEVGGVYTYNYKDMKVPDAFETIFWERKIGREYGVTIQLEDTTAMQYLQLALNLQDIIYKECEEPLLGKEIEMYFGKPTYRTKSFLAHAKTSYHYSFNKPNGVNCYHGEFMGNVAYQDCLTIIVEINNKDQIVELNTSSFDLSIK